MTNYLIFNSLKNYLKVVEHLMLVIFYGVLIFYDVYIACSNYNYGNIKQKNEMIFYL